MIDGGADGAVDEADGRVHGAGGEALDELNDLSRLLQRRDRLDVAEGGPRHRVVTLLHQHRRLLDGVDKQILEAFPARRSVHRYARTLVAGCRSLTGFNRSYHNRKGDGAEWAFSCSAV